GGAAKARFLLDLAQRARPLGFAGLELALGERPVALLGAVDQEHLELTALAAPRDHAPRRPHHAVQRHALSPRFSSLDHRRGNCPRSSARRVAWRSRSWPATRAAAAPRARAASSRMRC